MYTCCGNGCLIVSSSEHLRAVPSTYEQLRAALSSSSAGSSCCVWAGPLARTDSSRPLPPHTATVPPSPARWRHRRPHRRLLVTGLRAAPEAPRGAQRTDGASLEVGDRNSSDRDVYDARNPASPRFTGVYSLTGVGCTGLRDVYRGRRTLLV